MFESKRLNITLRWTNIKEVRINKQTKKNEEVKDGEDCTDCK